MNFKAWWNREVRFWGVLRESRPYHFYLLQAVGFLYLIYWFLSKDFTVYGFMQRPEGMFWEPVYQGWPIPWTYFTTGQFIYQFIPSPTPQSIEIMQWVSIAFATLGLLGCLPKLAAIVTFVVASHLVGLDLLFNSNMDGSTTLPLCLLLVLAVSPGQSFYRYNCFSWKETSVHYHWPVFLYVLLVASYYTTAGISKVIEIGPQWPWMLHLERLAARDLEECLFLSSNYHSPTVLMSLKSEGLSIALGFVTLLLETFFFIILWLPRYSALLILGMAVLHVMIFLTLGWNYMGYAVFLVLCLDLNAVVANLCNRTTLNATNTTQASLE